MAPCGGIVLEEALILSSDRILNAAAAAADDDDDLSSVPVRYTAFRRQYCLSGTFI